MTPEERDAHKALITNAMTSTTNLVRQIPDGDPKRAAIRQAFIEDGIARGLITEDGAPVPGLDTLQLELDAVAAGWELRNADHEEAHGRHEIAGMYRSVALEKIARFDDYKRSTDEEQEE